MPLDEAISAKKGSENIKAIKKALLKDPDLECVESFDCTSEDFQAIEPLLEEKNCKGIHFNAAQEKLRFVRMPTLMHAACATWLANWVRGMGDNVEDHIDVVSEGQLEGFEGDYEGSKKMPDGALFLDGRIWPTIVLEAGYSESYEDLKEDAKLLLEGSEGRIGFVILVKLERLQDGEDSIQSGFVELHYYNSDSQTTAQYEWGMSVQGQCYIKRLYPRPARPERQKISFSWRNVLRGHTDDIDRDSEAPPPLRLDDLRRLIDRSVPRYLAMRSEDSLDDEKNNLW